VTGRLHTGPWCTFGGFSGEKLVEINQKKMVDFHDDKRLKVW
jgi:hypothetical protein